MTLFWVFLRLGLTSFGGPIAHLGYFRDEFVARRRWLSDQAYSEIVALGQFLPGPASSQVGMSIGYLRGGFRGVLSAWLGFTLPSAIALIVFAYAVAHEAAGASGVLNSVLHALRLAAVAVIAQAVWSMAKAHCIDVVRVLIAIAATGISLVWSSPWTQCCVIGAAALTGQLLKSRMSSDATRVDNELHINMQRKTGVLLLVVFALLLAGLSVMSHFVPSETLQKSIAFYRTGALVFGGGHVVLPLLDAAVVKNGWVDSEIFLTGYGAAQAVPGPLFSFAAYLGVSMKTGLNGWMGGLFYLSVIFLPAFLLVIGVLPFWNTLRQNPRARSAFAGVNAAVVGILLAALYRPAFTSAVFTLIDALFVLCAFAALMYWKLPAWSIVLAAITFGIASS